MDELSCKEMLKQISEFLVRAKQTTSSVCVYFLLSQS